MPTRSLGRLGGVAETRHKPDREDKSGHRPEKENEDEALFEITRWPHRVRVGRLGVRHAFGAGCGIGPRRGRCSTRIRVVVLWLQHRLCGQLRHVRPVGRVDVGLWLDVFDRHFRPLPRASDAALVLAGWQSALPQRVFALGQGDETSPSWPRALGNESARRHAVGRGARCGHPLKREGLSTTDEQGLGRPVVVARCTARASPSRDTFASSFTTSST